MPKVVVSKARKMPKAVAVSKLLKCGNAHDPIGMITMLFVKLHLAV